VRLCIPPNFVDQARSHEFEALPMGIEMRLPAQKSGTTQTLTAEALRRLREPVPDLNTNQFETIDAAVNGCAVIVGANAHEYAAPFRRTHGHRLRDSSLGTPVPIPSPDLAPPPGARPAVVCVEFASSASSSCAPGR
jgi:vancomycin aglycone glucosyltransferase